MNSFSRWILNIKNSTYQVTCRSLSVKKSKYSDKIIIAQCVSATNIQSGKGPSWNTRSFSCIVPNSKQWHPTLDWCSAIFHNAIEEKNRARRHVMCFGTIFTFFRWNIAIFLYLLCCWLGCCSYSMPVARSIINSKKQAKKMLKIRVLDLYKPWILLKCCNSQRKDQKEILIFKKQ